MNQRILGLIFLSALFTSSVFAANNTISIQADAPGVDVSPTLYGIFFEEINRAGDGGIYAEMVQNRCFDDNDQPTAWTLVKTGAADAKISLDAENPLNQSRHHALRLDITAAGDRVGIANEGFKGMAVKQRAQYLLSFYARCGNGFNQPLTATLESAHGTILAQAAINNITGDWHKYSCDLTSSATDPAAHLVIATTGKGTIWFNVVSLFPKDTWKNRPNGLRPDLMEMIAAMKPSFVRFPGGAFVQGMHIDEAANWKTTIGDIAERPGHGNTIWGYRSSDGLGFYEYLQMCEDLKAEPLFVVDVGISLGGMKTVENVPIDQIQPLVQNAVDAVEYANGPIDSKWARFRAKAGHPAPFNLKYLEIGNESPAEYYPERFKLFYEALKPKYPSLKLIVDQGVEHALAHAPDIIDDHMYSDPLAFYAGATRYDQYDRSQPKIYMGEYACFRECGGGNLRAALAEAAYMTGLERNSDAVVMTSYAPLLCNVAWKHWNPDAINFDASRVFGTPSYYTQAIFSGNRPDVILPVEVNVAPVSQSVSGRIGVGTWMTQAEFKDIKVVKNGKTLFASDFSKGIDGWTTKGGQWEAIDGVLRQSGTNENIRAYAGDPAWSDYTYSLKARKISGSEGFLIIFDSDGHNTKSWWNLGGWGNHQHGLEVPGVTPNQIPGNIETGRWYDIRIEIKGPSIRCYLDDKLIQEATRTMPKPVYAVAGKKNATGEIIVKVVNITDEPQDISINLAGIKSMASTGKAIVLTSDSNDDENSFEHPTRVVPVESEIQNVSNNFNYHFAPHSLTVLRLTTAAN